MDGTSRVALARTPVSVRRLNAASLGRHLRAPLLVAIGYYLGAKVGFALTLQPVPVSPLWPPNATLLAGFVLTPTVVWPSILCASFVAHLAVQLQTGVPLAMVLCWFVSNSAEALIGAGVLRAAGRDQPVFDTLRGVALFLVGGAFLSSFLSSFLDAWFVGLNRWGGADYWTVWQTRFLANFLATLTLVPVIVITVRRLPGLRGRPGRVWAETAGGLLALLVVCWAAFVRGSSGTTAPPAQLYALLPLLVAAAVRGGPWAASSAMLTCAGMAIWGVQRGVSPFAGASTQETARSLQLFLIVTWGPIMALAAVLKERETAEARAKASEEQLAVALDAAQLGTWQWDVATERGSWSPRSGVLFSTPLDRPATLDEILALMHPDDRPMVEQALRRAIAERSGLEAEFRIGPPRNPRWIFTKGTTICAEDGTPVSVVGVNLDVTHAKRADFALQEHQRELAHLARVALVSELSVAVAHELNQPLAAILTNARTAQRFLSREPPDLRRAGDILEAIASDDLRAAAVVTRLRRLLRNEPQTMRPLHVNDVVADVVLVARADVLSRQVSMTSRLEHNLPRVNGDRIQLQQVLLNLVINGCDAMRGMPGPRLLTIATALDAAGRVRISVIDNGCGIPADQIEQIFEPFVTTKPHGVGLGLSICRSIVGAHEGRLWAENVGSGGAAFHLVLPAAPDERAGARAPAAGQGH